MSGPLAFPEIYRNAVSEARYVRLVAGAVTVNLVCLCFFLVSTQSSRGGETFFQSLVWMQALILLVYGGQRAAATVARERAERTWDFQRLTPLTSFEIAAGKLVGAPLFAYFLVVASLPWVLAEVVYFTGVGFGDLARAYLLLAPLSFVILSLALLASAYTNAHDSGSVNTGGAVLGFFGLSFVSYISMDRQADAGVSFFLLRVPGDLFFGLSAAAFGVWAFSGAMWRIGRDLLERRRWWRLPAFLLFLAVYVYGMTFKDARGEKTYMLPLLALILPAIFAYIGAMIHREGPEDWRRWLALRGEAMLDQTPVWVAAWATIVVIAALVGLSQPLGTWARLLVVIPAFLGRDFAFMQWCRFTKSRRPEYMAMAYLALVYVLPSMVLPAFRVKDLYFLFLPAVSDRVGAFLNILPGVLQVAAMGAILWSTLRREALKPED
ncbi:MAG: hypothetical protein HY927_07295 [Elusimicrobia bacterium]|nr:hypothetical protein [Elusimicrobiota bacterium]